MYFCSAYGCYFFVTWLPTYLVDEHGLTVEQSGRYSAVPLLGAPSLTVRGHVLGLAGTAGGAAW